MKKYLRIGAALIFVFAILYSVFWFYQSKQVRGIVDHALAKGAIRLGGVNSSFEYSDMKVQGFPLSFDVTIDNPKLNLRDKRLSLEVASQEPLLISSDVIGYKLKVVFPPTVNSTAINSDDVAPIKISWANPPVLVVKTSGLLFRAPKKDVPYESIHYSDSGYSVYKEGEEGVFASSGGTSYNVIREDGFDVIAFSNSNLKIDNLMPFASDLDLGSVDVSGNIKQKVSSDASMYEFVVDNFNFSSEIFSIDVMGRWKSAGAKQQPLGDLKVRLSNYENMVDYTSDAVNYAVENSAFPIFRVKSQQKDGFKSFLYSLATEKYNEGSDLMLVITSDDKSGIKVGQYNFFEVMGLFRESFN